MFHFATQRAKYLFPPFLENCIANGASFGSYCVSFCSPTVGNRARPTHSRLFPRNGYPTINAILRVFARAAYFPSVNFFMAGDTNSNAIVNIKSKVWKICKFFNMVGVKFNTYCSTLLASVIISFVNTFSPMSKTALKLSTFGLGRFPVFICIGRFSRPRLSSTRLCAELLIIVVGCKCGTTESARFFTDGTSLPPTIFRAITGCFSTVFFNFKQRATNHTSQGCSFFSVLTPNLIKALLRTVFLGAIVRVKCFVTDIASIGVKSFFNHIDIIPQHNNNTSYCAVTLQRYLDHTGTTPTRL